MTITQIEARLAEETTRWKAARRESIKAGLAIGELLVSVKPLVGHGSYLDWIAKQDIRERTAQHFREVSNLGLSRLSPEVIEHFHGFTGVLRFVKKSGRRAEALNALQELSRRIEDSELERDKVGKEVPQTLEGLLGYLNQCPEEE